MTSGTNGLERANAIQKGDNGTQGEKLGMEELLDQVFTLFYFYA